MKLTTLALLTLTLFACSPNLRLLEEDPFIKAIENNDIDKVKEIFKSGRITKDSRLTSAFPAVRAKTVEMLEALEALGFDHKWDGTEYRHMLFEILNGRNFDASLELIEAVIKRGHSVNFQPDGDKYTPAMLAVFFANKQRVEKLKILTAHGADYSLKDYKGRTLYQTLKAKDYRHDVIKYLESIGVNK